MQETVIKIENLKKQYRLGTIGGGTLSADLKSWWHKIRGKEDPNSIIGSKQYNNETFMALNGINLEIKKGDTIGIIGGNGAGKSTMLKLLSRVTAPTEGSISVKGRIASMLEVGTGFHPELTGRENIYLNGAILGMSRAEVNSKIEQIIDFSECRKFIDTPVKRYSSGMYVKLAFAVAAHLDSEILVMDEVLAVGDMKFQQKCLGKMGDVANKEGRTVLYVSHNMNTVRQLCNRCIVLDKGTIKYDGDTETAIQIYLDNYLETVPEVDFAKSRKNTTFDENKKCLLQRCKMIKQSSGIIKNSDKLVFELEWKNNIDIENLYLRVEYSTISGSVGTAFLDKPIKCYKGINNKEVFEVDISELAPNIYDTVFVLYEKNEFGYSMDCDYEKSISFEKQVDDDSYINWNHTAWGNIRLKNISLIER